jgi:hypothetical protein
LAAATAPPRPAIDPYIGGATFGSADNKDLRFCAAGLANFRTTE